MIWRFRGRCLTFDSVKIVGILNVTPDSFSDGGQFFSTKEIAAERALELERAGASVIDIGGESTRPGAKAVSIDEELDRVIPVIKEIRFRTKIPISIDTTKPQVARAALEAGADIINDVDGLGAAREMAQIAQKFEAGLILMHRRGNPETMQELARYEDVVREVFDELSRSLGQVVERGIRMEQTVLDPGIGFAKTTEQNLELIAGLEQFHSWSRPILLGPSRKSFIGALTGKLPRERDWGTAAAVALAVSCGAHLVRVHEVRAMQDVVKVAEAIAEKRGRRYVGSQ